MTKRLVTQLIVDIPAGKSAEESREKILCGAKMLREQADQWEADVVSGEADKWHEFVWRNAEG